MRDVRQTLARVPFFADLSGRDLKRLAALCVPKDFVEGAEILSEGAVGLGLYLITEGRVEVFKTEDGRRWRLAELGTGDVLGEMALIDAKPRSASAVALVPTAALLLSRDSFQTVVRKRPAVAWALVPELAGRLRDVENRLMAAERAVQVDKRAESEPETADVEPEKETEPSERSDESDDASGSSPGAAGGLLRAPYALVMSGLAGAGGSLRMARNTARALADALELERDGGLLQALGRLPRGTVTAAVTSFLEAGKIPVEMTDAFLRHWRGRE